MKPALITVFGATGVQGGGLVRALLDDEAAQPVHRVRVRAVTRRPGSAEAGVLAALGAEIIEADLDHAASVQRAMHGADAAFCVTDFWSHRSAEREVAQAAHLAEAAKREQVGHVVWSTLEDTRRFSKVDGWPMPVALGAGDGSAGAGEHGGAGVRAHRQPLPPYDGKGEADRQFSERELPLTRLLTSYRWDNLLGPAMRPRRAADGRLELALPTGTAALPGIAAADIGPCVAAILRQGPATIGRTVGIAGEHLSVTQMAHGLSMVLGELVRPAAVDAAEYARRPWAGAADWARFFAFQREFSRACCAARPVAATRVLHPGLLGFSAWLRSQAAGLRAAVR